MSTMTISQVREIVREDAKNNFDLYVPAKSCTFDKGFLKTPEGNAPMTLHSAHQLAERVGIKRSTFDNLKELGLLKQWSESISTAYEAKYKDSDEQILLRMRRMPEENGRVRVRAFLTSKYGIKDNLEMIDSLAEILPRVGLGNAPIQGKPTLDGSGMRISLKLALTDKLMPHSARAKEMMERKDPHHLLLTGTNNEVGDGGMSSVADLFRPACANLAIFTADRIVGARIVHRGNIDKLFAQLQGQIAGVLASIPRRLDTYWGLSDLVLPDPAATLRRLGELKTPNLGQRRAARIADERLPKYVNELGNNAFAVVQSITDFARDLEDAEKRELSAIAGNIVTLSPDQWVRLS